MKTILNWLCPALFGQFFCLKFGGDSSAATTNRSEVRDMRVVGGDASTNLSANNSEISITATDHSAVNAGVQLGTKAIDASTQNATNLMSTAGNMFSGALANINSASQREAAAYQSSLGAIVSSNSKIATDLATAFTDSKAPDKSILQVGAFAVVGLAAVMLLIVKK